MLDRYKQVCVIIGASHAGVYAAFALRKEGWEGKIILIDRDPNLPYHRPPLSKKFLVNGGEIEKFALKPLNSYHKAEIQLELGKNVQSVNGQEKHILLGDGNKLSYDKLILATGADAFVPPIPGLEVGKQIFTLRSAEDVKEILNGLAHCRQKQIAVVGGGFIGLEIAASLSQMGAQVCLIERELRLLSRVSCPEISDWFENFHAEKGVSIELGKELKHVKRSGDTFVLECKDGTEFSAEMIVVGVGVKVNLTLAKSAGLDTANGISVNGFMQTSIQDIYAIGDCSWHKNEAYGDMMRLESVQNAVEQAKIAASHICGNDKKLSNIPWFWSDQFDAKLQMVGLTTAYDKLCVRKESNSNSLSVWYFKGEKLIAVHAINHPKAYVLGTKFIKDGSILDQNKLQNPQIDLKPDLILA
ncbi:MAG: FAD-dependent oxidoreductase [Bacteroidia bacterium]|nr:FAD-dependent oxidoreductase [Bacteroidia bacterium]